MHVYTHTDTRRLRIWTEVVWNACCLLSNRVSKKSFALVCWRDGPTGSETRGRSAVMPLRCETKDPSSNPGPGSNPRWVRSDVPGPGACCLRPKGIHGHDGNESSVIVKSRDRRPRLPPEAELSARPARHLSCRGTGDGEHLVGAGPAAACTHGHVQRRSAHRRWTTGRPVPRRRGLQCSDACTHGSVGTAMGRG